MAYYQREEHSQVRPTRERQGRSTPVFGPLVSALGLSSLRKQNENPRAIKTRSGGWMQAGNASEWDLERSAEDLKSYTNNPTSRTMAEQNAAFSPQSFNTASLSPSSRIYIPESDNELNRERGYSYSEQSSLPRHSIVPSIQSQPCSPPSPLSLPLPGHATAGSPASDSMEQQDSSVENTSIVNTFADVSSWSTRTFSSGSKFVEGL